ncbi:hypothetical protein EDC19_1054 [Natranaerovirga hydrolytica]|uniref:Uncharacterized protein n=1 Tax=Natranaerovirga hydrolytica TaxID=680378 RepID=A0A4R1N136_9FIRM|nr:hypothetical protein [Natranaerovirga hydrolytica]TCK98622.1 hypothetical protein EDC19_1054 [Natranaerovirga hydrolytica]
MCHFIIGISEIPILEKDIQYMQTHEQISIIDVSTIINKNDEFFYYEILHGGCSCAILNGEDRLKNAVCDLISKYLKQSNFNLFIYEDTGGYFNIEDLYTYIISTPKCITHLEDFIFSFYSLTLCTEKQYLLKINSSDQ